MLFMMYFHLQESVQQVLDSKSRELTQEQSKSAALQRMLDVANQNMDKQSQLLAENTVQIRTMKTKVCYDILLQVQWVSVIVLNFRSCSLVIGLFPVPIGP